MPLKLEKTTLFGKTTFADALLRTVPAAPMVSVPVPKLLPDVKIMVPPLSSVPPVWELLPDKVTLPDPVLFKAPAPEMLPAKAKVEPPALEMPSSLPATMRLEIVWLPASVLIAALVPPAAASVIWPEPETT